MTAVRSEVDMSETKTEVKKAPGVGLIYAAIPAIMAEIPSICKDRKNTAQGYNFRGIDDVYNALNPILAKHQVFMRADVLEIKREERPSKSGGIMAFVQVRVRYSFVASDGSFVSTDALGEGMDSGDKATPKAMSIAQKYAILQMFAIPTAEPKDPEVDNPEPSKPLAATIQAKPEQKPVAPQASMVDLHNAMIRGIAVIEALGIGQTIESTWDAIHKEVKKKFNRDFAEASELSAEESAGVVDYLRRWYRHVMDGRKAVAAKHAEEVPRPDDEDDESVQTDGYGA
jgi:hypothetical protein